MGRPMRVVVVGGGPAGLAAAARLLEAGGSSVEVRLFTMGHHLGGKAASWRDAEGRLIDHGQHVVVGFYREMKALLRRAGVEPDEHLVSNQGITHVFETRDQQVHDLKLHRNPLLTLKDCLGYTGFSASELAAITRFVLRTGAVWSGVQRPEAFDDVCFTAWCHQHGLPASVIATNAFRISRDAQLNYPGESSAYLMLKAMGSFDRGYSACEYGFCDGGMSERFWEPIAGHVSRLGGEISYLHQLLRLELRGDRLTGLWVGEPVPEGHQELGGRQGPQSAVQHLPGSERLVEDFDAVVLAIPEACVRLLNPSDEAFWGRAPFSALRGLRSVPPLALQVWHRRPVTRRYPSVIAGLPPPLSFVLDNKPIHRESRDDPRYGSLLYFVGQEAGFEDLDDEALLRRCLDAVAPLPGYEGIDREGVLHFTVVRHRGPHGHYWYTEPGALPLRPHTRSGLKNLFFAGDWVRNELDFPCMEAAVRSGRSAADAALDERSPA